MIYFYGPNESDGLQNQKTQDRELIHPTMDTAACILKHPEMIQRAVNFCLEQRRLCTGNPGGHFKHLKDARLLSFILRPPQEHKVWEKKANISENSSTQSYLPNHPLMPGRPDAKHSV
jgi:hypothetical protein